MRKFALQMPRFAESARGPQDPFFPATRLNWARAADFLQINDVASRSLFTHSRAARFRAAIPTYERRLQSPDISTPFLH
jgi:hypothetical protein